ncbi:Protein unc-80 [Tyrophagus putrescentiae]|nr:Protein unc-80 [Tyrophagus putrescentiae]
MFKPNLENVELSIHHLFIDSLFCIVKQLGSFHEVASYPVQEVIINILHAFLRFCTENNSSAVHSSMPAQHLTAFPHIKIHSEHHSQNGYGNNFIVSHIPSTTSTPMPNLSRKNSLKFERTNYGGHESITIRMSKTMLLQILKDGMFKFPFLLESFTLVTLSDAQLVAAMLDLKAPVISRAAFLIKCSHCVHRCNRGQWLVWMHINFNFFRPLGMGACASRSSQAVINNRASTTLQQTARRTFYQWGELRSSRLKNLLQNDIELYGTTSAATAAAAISAAGSGGMAAIAFGAAITSSSITEVQDGRRSKTSVRLTPEEDNFLSVPAAGREDGSCPLALKVLACQLLHEITTFLRETHYRSRLNAQCGGVHVTVISRGGRLSGRTTRLQPSARPPVNINCLVVDGAEQHAHGHFHRPQSHITGQPERRRLNGAAGETLDHCSIINADQRIGFVLHETDLENDPSNDNREKKRLSQVNYSFRRRSIKLKKPQDKKGTAKLRSATLVEDELFKWSNSLWTNSRRKASGVSKMLKTSKRYSGNESPGLMSDDGHGVDSLSDTLDASDAKITTNPSVVHNMDMQTVERGDHHGTLYSSTTALVCYTVDLEMGVFEISYAASVAVILCALKVPGLVVELLNKELNNASVEVRVNTIHKFYKPWISNRYQCWQRLNDGVQGSLKLPPAAIEFTLPSPRIALECQPVVDPPYMSIVKTKMDEVAINQELDIQKSFVAATKTRRKH